MTPENARLSANILLAVAAGAAVFAVLRNRRWRRAVGQLIRVGVTTALPRMVADETRRAWADSGNGP